MNRNIYLISTILCLPLVLSGCKKHTPPNTSITTNTPTPTLHLSTPDVATPVPAACQPNIFRGLSPLMPKELAPYTRIICYNDYAVITSGISHTGLFSMEHLTPEKFAGHEHIPRRDRFHPDPHLPPGWSASIKDYVRSGYDKGHLSPSGDMTTPESQEESFSLANMAPQDPHLNRGLWANIEAGVKRTGEQQPLYVVTGTAYTSPANQQLTIGNNHVFVPTYYWKAVLSEDGKIHGIYMAENTLHGTGRWMMGSLKQGEEYMHAIPFPNLPPNIINAPPNLPSPINIDEEHRR